MGAAGGSASRRSITPCPPGCMRLGKGLRASSYHLRSTGNVTESRLRRRDRLAGTALGRIQASTFIPFSKVGGGGPEYCRALIPLPSIPSRHEGSILAASERAYIGCPVLGGSRPQSTGSEVAPGVEGRISHRVPSRRITVKTWHAFPALGPGAIPAGSIRGAGRTSRASMLGRGRALPLSTKWLGTALRSVSAPRGHLEATR